MSEKEQNRALEVQFASRYPRVLELGTYRRLYCGTEPEEIEQPSSVAVDEVHLHSGDNVSPVQQKSTVANKSQSQALCLDANVCDP